MRSRRVRDRICEERGGVASDATLKKCGSVLLAHAINVRELNKLNEVEEGEHMQHHIARRPEMVSGAGVRETVGGRSFVCHVEDHTIECRGLMKLS
jgi:hypothetical protein